MNVLRGGFPGPASSERQLAILREGSTHRGRHRLSITGVARRHSLEVLNMKCMQCGSAPTTKSETYLYDRLASARPYSTSRCHRCTACGDYEVEIPRIAQLNQALANTLIRQPTRLTAAEIRFLRKALGWSGIDFARHMGVDPATVSRWEAGAKWAPPRSAYCG